MATRIIVQQICDPCGEYAEGVEITTMRITLDGKEYELDICEDHKTDMQATWLHVARRAQKNGSVKPQKAVSTPTEPRPAADATRTPSGVLRTLKCSAKGCDRMFGDTRSLHKHQSAIHGIPTLKVK